MSGKPGAPADGGDQRELVARLRAVIEAKDAENVVLREWCRIRSYPDSDANHGLTALDVITRALAATPGSRP